MKVITSVSAEDCGQPINPLLVDGQNEGGIIPLYKLPEKVAPPLFFYFHGLEG